MPSLPCSPIPAPTFPPAPSSPPSPLTPQIPSTSSLLPAGNCCYWIPDSLTLPCWLHIMNFTIPRSSLVQYVTMVTVSLLIYPRRLSPILIIVQYAGQPSPTTCIYCSELSSGSILPSVLVVHSCTTPSLSKALVLLSSHHSHESIVYCYSGECHRLGGT